MVIVLCIYVLPDNGSLPPEDVFLHRLSEKGATESSSANGSIPCQMQECRDSVGDKVQNTFRNIVHAIDGAWGMKDGLYAESIKQLPEGGKTNSANVYVVCLAVIQIIVVYAGSCTPNSSIELEREVKNMRLAIADMHLKHRSLAREMQLHRDTDAKNKSELRQLKGN